MDKEVSLAILSRVRSEKQAEAGALDVIRDAATAPLRQQALQDILRTALVSGGIGAAAGGGVGLFNMLRRNLINRKRTTHVAEMPIPVSTADDNQPMGKTASWLTDLLKGKLAETQAGIPWELPGKIGAGMGAAALGYKGVDALMRYQRKKQEEADIARAKAEFEQAMAEQGGAKQAADSGLAADLDRLYVHFEKAAGILDAITPSPETQGQILGGYGAYAIPTALVAGYAAFKAADKNSQRNVIKKALKLRNRRRQALEPAEIYAKSVPANSIED